MNFLSVVVCLDAAAINILRRLWNKYCTTSSLQQINMFIETIYELAHEQWCSGKFGAGGTPGDGGTEGPEQGAEARSAGAPRGWGLAPV